MNILLIHQNFPGQFLHLAGYLSAVPGNRVFGIGEKANIQRRGTLSGVTTLGYETPQGAGTTTHHYLHGTEAALRRGQAVARVLLRLKNSGFIPDLIVVHPGWGEGMFIRDVFPDTPTVMFCEFFFRAGEADIGFDLEFPVSDDFLFSVRIRNTPQILSLMQATACISPTRWQASRYPEWIRKKIHICHEGVDTSFMTPDHTSVVYLHKKNEAGESVASLEATVPQTEGGALIPEPPVVLRKGQKIILFMARNLEPYRGWHHFARALPDIQKRHPDAVVVIVGKNGTSYSNSPPEGATYKALYLDEVREALDFSRIHFVGQIPYPVLRALYRTAMVHAYLTYPFVLSWSALESMACGGLLAASRTAPVEEVITHEKNGLLFDFFDREEMLECLDRVLNEPEAFEPLRAAARQTVLEYFNLPDCLERQADILRRAAKGEFSPEDR